MPIFKCKSVDKKGKIYNDTIVMSSSDELRYHMKSLTRQIIEYSEISTMENYGRSFLSQKISAKSLLYCCSMMKQLLGSGIDFANSIKPCFILIAALFLFIMIFAFIAPIYSMSNIIGF